MQKTLLIGYLGKDPEMKYTPGGTPVAAMVYGEQAFTAVDISVVYLGSLVASHKPAPLECSTPLSLLR